MYLIRRREDGHWWQCYDALGGGDFWALREEQGRTFASAAEAEEEMHWLTDPVDIIERPDARPIASPVRGTRAEVPVAAALRHLPTRTATRQPDGLQLALF